MTEGVYNLGLHFVDSHGVSSNEGYYIITVVDLSITRANVFPTPGVSPTPVVSVSTGPSSVSGDLNVLLIGDVLVATPSASSTSDPIFTASPQPNQGLGGAVVEIHDDPNAAGGNYDYGFSFSSAFRLDPSGSTTTLALGRYNQAYAGWNPGGNPATPPFTSQFVQLSCYNLSNDPLNDLLGSAPTGPAMSLAVDLAVLRFQQKDGTIVTGSHPIIVYSAGTGPRGETAEAFMGSQYPKTGLIFWWNGSLGPQDPQQVLFHELDHHFYEGAQYLPNPCPTGSCTATFTLPSPTPCPSCPSPTPTPTPRGKPTPSPTPTVFTWNLSPTRKNTTSQGYFDYEHLLIHNDIVVRYFPANPNGDTTGALGEAFGTADPIGGPYGLSPTPTPTQLQWILSYYKNRAIAETVMPAAQPPTGYTCSQFGLPNALVGGEIRPASYISFGAAH